MLKLNEIEAAPRNANEPRQFQTYNVFYGSFLRRSAFGLHRDGILYFDNTQNKIEVSGEGALPFLIALPLRLIPVVGRGILTFYRPAVAVSFKQTEVSEFVRQDRRIQFKAPKQSGARLRRVNFSAANEAEAQEIEAAIRQQNPDVTPGKYSTGWRWVKLAAAAAAGLIGLIIIAVICAGIYRYAKQPEGVKISQYQIYGVYPRPLADSKYEMEYPPTEKGMFRRGGNVLLKFTILPDGTIKDLKQSPPQTDMFAIKVTDNPVLIEAATNMARDLKYKPAAQETRIEILFKFATRLDRAFDSTLP